MEMSDEREVYTCTLSCHAMYYNGNNERGTHPQWAPLIEQMFYSSFCVA